ncbi:Arginyl-tRNA--protein transferase 1 [Mycoemilia scoparia]|uniref:Arginyl-tRNA--protein transferase 1 n=1 Tax=Mycoemilia scoparia TaxID=417184 RepID=A0A9W8A0B6_9FUNG|nr:Arginyl-tRNA--protein transferase 1 [Mycoemilia scoparia]
MTLTSTECQLLAHDEVKNGKFKYPEAQAFDAEGKAKSIVQAMGLQPRANCGYCSREKSQRVLGAFCLRLEPEAGGDQGGSSIFQTSRRTAVHIMQSGGFSTPDRLQLNAVDYQPTKGHKKVLCAMRKYLIGKASPANVRSESKAEFTDLVRMYDSDRFPGAGKKLKVTLEKGSCTREKFEIYKAYQREIHKDNELDYETFGKFLCAGPLSDTPIPNAPADAPVREYGLYHQLYRIDGKLVAVGVLDILPRSISSVYLFYDPEYSHLSLGNYSSLREIALTQTMNRYIPDLKYYSMGYYIQSCPKMAYKGQFSSSELLDVITRSWVPISKAKPLIDASPHFTSFIEDDKSHELKCRKSMQDKFEISPSFDFTVIPTDEMREAVEKSLIMTEDGVECVLTAAAKSPQLATDFMMLYAAIGQETMKRVLVDFALAPRV